MYLKMASEKWRQFCPGGDELTIQQCFIAGIFRCPPYSNNQSHKPDLPRMSSKVTVRTPSN